MRKERKHYAAEGKLSILRTGPFGQDASVAKRGHIKSNCYCDLRGSDMEPRLWMYTLGVAGSRIIVRPHELVTNSSNRNDEFRMSGICFQFLSKARYMKIDRAS